MEALKVVGLIVAGAVFALAALAVIAVWLLANPPASLS